ncbi:hypothetical protein F5Y13DRAFT_158551 [Hypoxylon sp. FL1857]|nr:hypothetical protein F5Y13DRAFT_158551 [Hypoxylon sp. FL1857]
MPLQDLLPELLVSLLGSAECLSDLRAIASTSKRIYSVFEDEKAALIYRVLSNELGPVLSDALALSKTESLDASSPSYHQQVRNAVSMYAGYLSGQKSPSPRRLPLDYVLSLVNCYRIMKYLADVYIKSKLMLFQNEINPRSSSSPSLMASPSRTERLRVLRAFYRLQIIFNLYGNAESSSRREYNELDTECINYHLFGLWEPWELQQVSCVAAITQRLYVQFARIEDYFLRKEGTSRRVYFGLTALRNFIEKLRASHNAIWQTTLRETSNLEIATRVRGMFVNYKMEWFHCRHHEYRMKTFPHGKYSYPTLIHFDGDCVTSAPFAWVDAFDGQYALDFFASAASNGRADSQLMQLGIPMGLAWSRLGFVIWDAPRVTTLKRSSVLTEFATGWALGHTTGL